MTMSSDLYQEEILDHYRNPRNHGTLSSPDAHFEDVNPLCGDRLAVDIKYDDDVVKDIRFDGVGCAISQAAASMLSELVAGRTKTEALAVTREDLLEEIGVPLSAARLKCALLSFKVLRAALYGVPMDIIR